MISPQNMQLELNLDVDANAWNLIAKILMREALNLKTRIHSHKKLEGQCHEKLVKIKHSIHIIIKPSTIISNWDSKEAPLLIIAKLKVHYNFFNNIRILN